MRIFKLFLFCLLSMGTVFAQDITDADDFDLGALLNTEVSTGSEKARKISDSPSIITVITKDDIDKSGAQNLYDVLSTLPGVQLIDTYWRGRTLVFRGILMSHYNDKTLLLVNGVPFYEAVNREYYLNSIPVSAIRSIEVIRGPGSVMYGTNAFAGVINVKTVTGGSEKASSYIEGKLGSQSTMGASLVFQKVFTNELEFMFSASYHGDDGYDSPPFADMAGTVETLNFEDDYYNFFANVRYGGFSFDFSYYKEEFWKFGMVPHFSFSGDHTHEGINLSITYKHEFNDQLSFDGWIRYNDHDRVSSAGIWGSYGHDPVYDAPNYWGYKGNVMQASFKFNYKVSNEMMWSFGASMENLSYDDVLTLYDNPERDPIHPTYIGQTEISSDSNKEYFFQVEGDPKDWIGYVAGGRYVKLDSGESDFSPRLGIVFRIKDGLSVKTLFQKSFRAPAPLEMYTYIPSVLNGDINLKPETNETMEVALDWMASENTSIRVNIYDVSVDDLILREVKGDPPTPTYSNLGSASYNGLEIEFKTIWNDNYTTFANISIAKGENEDGEDLKFFAEKMANLGLDWKINDKFYSTFRVQYIGEREGELTSGEEYTQDSYTLFNITLKYKITDNIELKLTGVNVTDETYFYPEPVRRTTTDYPGGMPASFFGSIRYKF